MGIYSRDQNKTEVISFLQKHFPAQNWEIILPYGTGNETYLARSDRHSYFIKLGVQIEKYQVMSALGLTPQVIESGSLEDETSILVQQEIAGRKPTRNDFHLYLEKFAHIIRKTHRSDELIRILPKRTSDSHKDVGQEVLGKIKQRWEKYKSQVPTSADYVDESLVYLRNQINQFHSSGLVASHNDICNANWLVSDDDKIYLIDLESMSQDDPALDIGALLWWYYPPEIRGEFLRIVGYDVDEHIQERMRIRMAIHCLHIILPREHSFDKFKPDSFDASLEDFRAVIKGKENPKGYYD